MNKEVQKQFNAYPPKVQRQLSEIRNLIFEIAEEKNLGVIDESIRWGEPSYSAKGGSPIRIDWKARSPNQISLFVNCKTRLIDTYKALYGNTFTFIGNREVVLPLSKPIPLEELRACILMALQYHKLKSLPLLGADITDNEELRRVIETRP